jgi:hypothetical protein
MKTVIVAAAGLAVAQASIASLGSNIKSYVKAHNTTSSRALSGDQESFFEAINGYGCWCYLDSEWRDADQVLINRPSILAKGRIVDAIDESCRNLINSYKCIEMDAEEAGDVDCDAQAVPYTAYDFEANNGDIKTECETNNAANPPPHTQCSIDACIAEAAFVLSFADVSNQFVLAMTDNADYNVANVHASRAITDGTFDPAVSCPGIPNPVGSDKKCCGMHSMLTRHPYRLDSGFTTRSCCNNQVINNELNQCCGLGTDASPENVVDINDNCPAN